MSSLVFWFCFSYYISYTLVFHLQDPDLDFELWCHVTGRWDKMFQELWLSLFLGPANLVPHLIQFLIPMPCSTCLTLAVVLVQVLWLPCPALHFFAFLSSSIILVLGTWGMRQCNLVIGSLLGLEFLEFSPDSCTC